MITQHFPVRIASSTKGMSAAAMRSEEQYFVFPEPFLGVSAVVIPLCDNGGESGALSG
jgi:hypothetical protein